MKSLALLLIATLMTPAFANNRDEQADLALKTKIVESKKDVIAGKIGEKLLRTTGMTKISGLNVNWDSLRCVTSDPNTVALREAMGTCVVSVGADSMVANMAVIVGPDHFQTDGFDVRIIYLSFQ